MEQSVRSTAWLWTAASPPPRTHMDSRDLERCRREDRALVRRMLAGDGAAFEVFARDYLPPLFRFALRRLQGDRELTREIVQATVCKAIAKLDGFRGEALLGTWLCACCRNEIAAHFRHGSREVPLDDTAESGRPALAVLQETGDGPEAGTLRRERAELVHRALDALPPHYGRILEWKYLEDLPVEEIARRLERHPKAAESLLTRAREAFRRGFLARENGLGGQEEER
jgi:RNA polymerase sigma-70 factor, ECF subfamily